MLPSKKALLFSKSKPRYILNDDFTTNRAAGAVNGTPAEPTGQTRTVTDTSGVISTSGGQAVFASGGLAVGDPGILYPSLGSRTAGMVITGKVTTASTSTSGLAIGIDSNTTGAFVESIRVNNSLISIRKSATVVNVGICTHSVPYKLFTAIRATGTDYFIQGGVYTYPTLMFRNDSGTNIPIPGIEGAGAAIAGAAVDYIRIPSIAPWLPTPLASDGFGSIFGTTDGLGHAEGITGGVGAGGSGVVWTQDRGTWTNAIGIANASALSSGNAFCMVDLGKTDVLIMSKTTRSAGNVGVMVRYVDDSNFIFAYTDGTNAYLIKKVAGVNTTVISGAITYSANTYVKVACRGTTFRLYYNQSHVGADASITDAELQTGTKHGLYTSDTGNTFDDFQAYSSGTSGEYSFLGTL